MFLFVLVRDLEFAIDPTLEIEKKVKYVPSWLCVVARCSRPCLSPPASVVTRPCVKSEPHRGNQMPLYIRRVSSPSDPDLLTY